MWRWNAKSLDNDEVVDRLKKIMIRHTKSQRIGGEVALSLPDTDHATVWLDMSDDEARALLPSLPLSPRFAPPTPRPHPFTRRSSTTRHGCKDGCLALYGDTLAEQLKARRKGCAHLYDQNAVHGREGYRAATAEEKAEHLLEYGYESKETLGKP